MEGHLKYVYIRYTNIIVSKLTYNILTGTYNILTGTYNILTGTYNIIDGNIQ